MTAVLYSALTKTREDQCMVWKNGRYVWVRMDVTPADIDEALEKARPRKGETVLNSIPLDETS